MRVFSVVDRSILRKRRTHRGSLAQPAIEAVEFSPDATLLVVCCDAADVGPWDVQRGELCYPESPHVLCPGTRAAFHPSGRWLVGGSLGGGLAIRDLETAAVNVQLGQALTPVVVATFSADGTRLLCFASAWGTLREVNGRSWDARFSPPGWTCTLAPEVPSFGWDVRPIAVPGRTEFMAGEFSPRDGWRIVIRDDREGEFRAGQYFPRGDHLGLAVAPTGRLIAVALGRDLHLWSRFATETPVRTITRRGRKHYTGVAFHPSGKYLAATSNDETVEFYDTETWQVVKVYRWQIGRMRSIAFSRDGMLAAAGGDRGEVVVWDIDL